MTKKFHPNRTLSLDYIVKNIDNIDFLSVILPKEQIKVKSKNNNHIQLVYYKPLNYQVISEIKIKMDLINEQKKPDELSTLIWDFSTKNNSHFYNFSGRIRVKRIGNNIKIGIYIYDMQIDNEKKTKLGLRAMKKAIKAIIIQIFQNLTKLK